MTQQLLPPDIKPEFPLGPVVVTANALARLPIEDVSAGLARHAQGDWGDIDATYRLDNEVGLKHGFRVRSVYHDRNGTEFWIITDDGHDATTVLLPEDY